MLISGKLMKSAIVSASLTLNDSKKLIDELNVYPVPDGDTGTNMSLTMSRAAEEMMVLPDSAPVEEVVSRAASAMIRGARGNSGVITSLLFRGISKGLAGKTEAGCEDIANAFEMGVANAYKAVMKPVEGTILTVARVTAEKARELSFSTNDVIVQWTEMVAAAKDALEKTPTQLAILKKAGVVDAGGKGFVVIISEMLKAFKGEPRTMPAQQVSAGKSKLHIEIRDDEEIVYAYCTEYIVNGEHTPEQAQELRTYLESIGNCAVVVDDDDIIKIHVHTNNPGLAFEKGLTYGYLSNMKIDNMRLQRQNRILMQKQREIPKPVEAEKEFGFVAVANGDGIINTFSDLGTDSVVRGGQTMNPSSEDILRAVYSVPANTVFVLPNNKNIIMAAEQAMKISERTMYVLPTTSIPQGIAALNSFDADSDFDTNRQTMLSAADKAGSGIVTYASRNSTFGGHDIHIGDIMALENGRLSFIDKDLVRAAYKLMRKLVKAQRSSEVFVTVFVGEDVPSEKCEELENLIKTKMSSVTVNFIKGGQPISYFIICVESM